MKTLFCDVLILSDLHLGSKMSKAREALQLLQSMSFERLILLGDIFCDLNFRRLNKEHWQFLSYIRKLSNPKRAVEVIWVEGNHDYGLTDVMSHLVGVPVHQEYIWESDGEWHLAIHGHQFDRLITKNNSILNRFIGQLYLFIQKLEPRGVRLAQLFDRLDTCWQRLTPKVAKGALAYAKSLGVTRVFCGHTHEPITFVGNSVHYYNAGSWTSAQPSFITVCGKEIQIHEFTERIDDCYSGEERGEAFATVAGFAEGSRLPLDVEYENIFS